MVVIDLPQGVGLLFRRSCLGTLNFEPLLSGKNLDFHFPDVFIGVVEQI